MLEKVTLSEEAVLKASEIAHDWPITIFYSRETKSFYGQVKPLSVFGFGDTRGECADDAHNALVLYLADSIQRDVALPLPPNQENQEDEESSEIKKMREDLGLSKVQFLKALKDTSTRLALMQQKQCEKASLLFHTMFGCGNDISFDSMKWLKAHLRACESCRTKMEKIEF
ncbi:MAG: hypothetical protein KGI50_02000 [Patescibacteria group bacterium]|nr:hypothetical protein [Patescibacteria group bacterium]MDE2437882.1 hypothetical protein [Patescibacteria group bacterium]